MATMKSRLAWLVLGLAWAGAAMGAEGPPKPFPCDTKDRECVHKALHTHPARRFGQWEANFAQPLLERIAPAPPELIEYLNWDNTANGYPNRPRPADIPPIFLAEVKLALAELPREVQMLFVDSLAGIALVDDLGGTGYTDTLIDTRDREVAGFIVLDAGVLQRFTANEWATWKESSPFVAQAGWTLEARIEPDSQDNRRNAIQYILLHELGHVLSIGRNVHPPWTSQPKDAGPDDAYPFFRLSWRTDANANQWVAPSDDVFPLRKDVAYYFGAKLPADRMVETYAQLARTNFPTLYAAVHPADDFAESFASYVHTVMMGKPWSITLRRAGDVAATVSSCWEQPRCAPKRQLLESILRR